MQQRLVAVGGQGDVSFSLLSLPPPGLEMDADGYIHGVPTQRGVFDLAVQATDGTQTATRTIPLTVAEPGRLTLVAASLPEAILQQEYNYQLAVLGSVPTATVSFSTMEPLPDGVSLTSSGRLVGVPTRVGSWTFAVTAREGSGPAASQDSAVFRLAVVADPGFGVTPSSIPEAIRGEEYEAFLDVRMGVAPFVWRVVGPTLPRGLLWEVDMSPDGRSRLKFSGTPEETGLVTALVTVEDSQGRRVEQPIAVRVVDPPVPVNPNPPDEGCGCRQTRSEGTGAAWALLALPLWWLARRRRRGMHP